MKILIIAHNSLSAGTSTQTISYVKYLIANASEDYYHIILPKTENFVKLKSVNSHVKIVFIPYYKGILGYLFRTLIEILVIPFIIIRTKPESIFSLANYFLVPGINVKKIILLRHPYLVDIEAKKNLEIKDKIKEFLRLIIFKFSISNVSIIIVQTEYMKEMFISHFPRYKHRLIVIPNPLNANFSIDQKDPISFEKRDNIIIYPSRYYPHKNHKFLINLVLKNIDFFRSNKIKLIITLKNGFQENELINEIEEKNIGDIIVNIGEVNEQILIKYYNTCKAIIFPSKSETFGNALIEGLFYSIPIIAPDLPYVRTVCNNAAVYYENNNIIECIKAINRIIFNEKIWKDYSRLSSQRSKTFLIMSEWNSKIEKILKY